MQVEKFSSSEGTTPQVALVVAGSPSMKPGAGNALSVEAIPVLY